MSVDPWWWEWNYKVIQWLFVCIAHARLSEDLCDILISTPILSTWIFAAAYYVLWIKNDSQQPRRRAYLLSLVFVLAVDGLVTLLVRPVIHWPAPVLNPHFRNLYPRYRWGIGNWNCFPSHSTLAYFTVGAGFWPVSRRLSVCLLLASLLLISVPRLYVGGHYPIDVIFSWMFAFVTLVLTWRNICPVVLSWNRARFKMTTFWNLCLFLWLFELGEGFRGVEFFLGLLRHAKAHW